MKYIKIEANNDTQRTMHRRRRQFINTMSTKPFNTKHYIKLYNTGRPRKKCG